MAKRKRTETKATLVNLPLEIRAWLEQRAADEGRTLTVLISRALRAEMALDAKGKRRA